MDRYSWASPEYIDRMNFYEIALALGWRRVGTIASLTKKQKALQMAKEKHDRGGRVVGGVKLNKGRPKRGMR